MGWLIYSRYNSPKTYAEEKAEILRLHTASADAPVRYEVLQVSNPRPFWVCAVKVIPLTAEKAEAMRNDSRYITAEDGSYTFASVIKTCRAEGGWGYKDGDEATGFYGDFSKVPASLIAKLSPLRPDSGQPYCGIKCAREWRESILAAKSAPKLKEGMRIRLDHPALFSAGRAFGVWCNDFTVTSYRRRGQNRRAYLANDIGGALVRLTESHAKASQIIA